MLKRLLFFAYGVASYLIFLATFLYAIAFVGGFAVPSRLDGPLQTSLPAALAIDALLLTIFAVQHSVMARPWFKERWTQIVPWAIERSTYVLCASLALLLLFWQWRPIGVPIWSVENPARARRCCGRCSPPAGRPCSSSRSSSTTSTCSACGRCGCRSSAGRTRG